MALMEAMSVGMPCIVSRIRGNVDLIEEDKGGFFFDSKDSATLVTAIRRMVAASSDTLTKMGAVNQENMKKFDKQTVNACMGRLYRELSGEQ